MSTDNPSEGFIPIHGGYRNLITYQKSEIIYDGTVYFNEQKQKANALQSEIDRVDKDIDQMVYGLYGLTEEEIRIVEGKL